ncbi:MAG: cytochrome c biogenesis protein CcsA [Candidatus Omnitrophica bacterium]|nr:cytochrome c biogenesis protein CcsA [Candidatus Omnitrophota bacterium]
MLYNIIFFLSSMFFYFVGIVCYGIYVYQQRQSFFEYSRQWFAVAVLTGLFFLIVRYREQGYLPLVSLFEITFFFAWLLSGVYILFIKEGAGKVIQSIALCIFNGIFIWDLFLDKISHPLNPLLNSFWLGIHVPSVILSYSAFGLSFAISIYYIIAEKKGKPVSQLEALNANLILFGTVLLGFGIVTGSIWAHSAWGRYWSWDPKETWALITFIIYSLAVVLRKVFRIKPFWQAVVSVVGFLAMLITFFGVSLFMASHHAYR